MNNSSVVGAMCADDKKKWMDPIWGDEYLALPQTPSSETRLENLPQDAWSPRDFAAAANALLRRLKLDTRILKSGDPLPPAHAGARFKYPNYEDLVAGRTVPEDVVVGVVLEQGEVVAYAIATCKRRTTMEVLNVDTHRRRDMNVSESLAIGSEQFTVGLGHAVVAAMLDHLPRPILVDATTTRYLFKSLGFRPRRGTTNPCLLRLK